MRDLGLDKGQQKQDRAYINMNASDNDRDGRIILTPHTETYRQRKIKTIVVKVCKTCLILILECKKAEGNWEMHGDKLRRKIIYIYIYIYIYNMHIFNS